MRATLRMPTGSRSFLLWTITVAGLAGFLLTFSPWRLEHVLKAGSGIAFLTVPEVESVAYSASWDEALRTWDLRTGECIRAEQGKLTPALAPFYPQNAPTHLPRRPYFELSLDAKRLMYIEHCRIKSHNDGLHLHVRVWDLVEGRSVFSTADHGFVARNAALAPDGTKLVIAAVRSKKADVFDLTKQGRLFEIACDGEIGYIRFSGDGRVILIGAGLSRFDATTGAPLGPAKGYTVTYPPCIDSPDGRLALSWVGGLYRKGTLPWFSIVHLYDRFRRKQLAELRGPYVKPIATTISTAGEYVLIGDSRGEIYVWRPRRPGRWWGVFWLPFFWVTAAFAAAVAYSLWRDRKLAVSRCPGDHPVGEKELKIAWSTIFVASVWAVAPILAAFAVRHFGDIMVEMVYRGCPPPPLPARTLFGTPGVMWVALGLLGGGALIWKSKLVSAKTANRVDKIAVIALGVLAALFLLSIKLLSAHSLHHAGTRLGTSAPNYGDPGGEEGRHCDPPPAQRLDPSASGGKMGA